jgi:hypothetical protein
VLKTPHMKKVVRASRPPTAIQRVRSTSLLQSTARNLPAPVRAAAMRVTRAPQLRAGNRLLPPPPVAPVRVRPIAPGAMPRKVWVSPKVAVPPHPRAPGAAATIPGVFDRLTRGRVQQRGTR